MTKVRFSALFLLTAILPLAHAQTFTVLHQFNSQSDGAFSEGSVLRDSAGNIFGTTTNPSTVFKISANGKESVFFNINGGDLGNFPTGSLAQDAAGISTAPRRAGAAAQASCTSSPRKAQETVLFAFQGGAG